MISALAAVGAMLATLMGTVAMQNNADASSAKDKQDWWSETCRFVMAPPALQKLPSWQKALFIPGLIAVLFSGPSLLFILLFLLFFVGPALWIKRAANNRRKQLHNQVVLLLTRLSGALHATPNLHDALNNIQSALPEPTKSELARATSQLHLGADLNRALQDMATRCRIPALFTAVLTLTIGRSSGGDLAPILKRTADTLREIDRLEGVLKTSMAGGMGQAVVMGLMPPFLTLMLHFINPEWLHPLWHDPIGWCILAAVCVLEIIAIVLIRRITAVAL